MSYDIRYSDAFKRGAKSLAKTSVINGYLILKSLKGEGFDL
jgi:hypothetical protein